ncbi:MAG: DUF885 domain-containing protein [Actinomycetales bacterium]
MSEPERETPASLVRYRGTATRVLDALLESEPVWATQLGDHRFDHALPDLSAEAIDQRAGLLNEALAALDGLDDAGLDSDDLVDLESLRTKVSADLWTLTELRPQEWDPIVHLPGDAIYTLVARDTGEPVERARALAARLRAVPRHLQTARERLGDMPRVHVETARLQLAGCLSLLGEGVDELLERAPTERVLLDEPRETARQALLEYGAWLGDRAESAGRDPRLGERAFAARLWYALDTEIDPDALLTRAESDLMALEEEIASVAARIGPGLGVVTSGAPSRAVRDVLDALAASGPVTNETVLPLCRRWLKVTQEVVREHNLVTMYDDPVRIIEMPESRRGVSVAYCEPPGALEGRSPRVADGEFNAVPTLFAVSPAPADWGSEQVGSYYREYNRHMLLNLTVHEAMPGHVLQLQHSRRYRGNTDVRAALGSGTFIEGWAVHAEQLVADAVARSAPEGVDVEALRMQQLKMRLRSTINAILDVRVHSRGMSREEAMRLMTVRGHQEEREAAGKWRRALLTSAQLSTYYVGHQEVSAIARDLAAEQPGLSVREVHDTVLAHGSPSPRLLRLLLELVSG